MQNTRFSFGNLFDQSQISKIQKPITQTQTHSSQQPYKQKYLQCKQNIQKFMQMVEKQFEQLTKKHNAEKQTLKKEISQLKSQLNQKNNDVSNFTVRSKKSFNTNQKPSHQNRSISQQGNQTGILSFQGIQGFDQSKIHSRSKSIVDKNLSTLSAPNTLIKLQNAFNQKKSYRITSKISNALGDITQNDIKSNSLNFTQYTSQILRKRKSKIEDSKQKQTFDVLMEKMIEKNILSQVEKEKSCKKAQQSQLNQPEQPIKNKNNKQNITSKKNNQIQQKSKTQQASVRNILKNLRSTMKTNIEKESNLEATITLSTQR